jgi:hypothetical protein
VGEEEVWGSIAPTHEGALVRGSVRGT